MTKDKFVLWQIKWVLIAWLTICILLLFQYLIASAYYPDFYTTYKIIVSILIRIITGVIFIIYILIPSYNYLKKRKIIDFYIIITF